MRYEEFRAGVTRYLLRHPNGATWRQLKAGLRLSYKVPCYTWIYRMEEEAGLRRIRGPHGMVWSVDGGHRKGRTV